MRLPLIYKDIIHQWLHTYSPEYIEAAVCSADHDTRTLLMPVYFFYITLSLMDEE